MSRILLAVSLLLGLVSASTAAEVKLGSEKALTPLGVLVPAAGTQDGPAVASNGHDFLAIWRDQRRELPVESPDLFASRLTRDGQPVDRVGHRITEKVFSTPVIASNGTEYLACFVAGGHLVSQRLDENGVPIAPPTELGLTTQPFFLRSNGTGYLLVGGKDIGAPNQSTTALLLDRAGAPLGPTMALTGKPKAAGPRNGGYVIVTKGGLERGSFVVSVPRL